MVSFRGQKKLGPRTDRSPLGFNSKFPTSIPTLSYAESPPVTPGRCLSFVSANLPAIVLGVYFIFLFIFLIHH